MKELIERSYKAIQERGLITDNTSNTGFLFKCEEELVECWKAKSDINKVEDYEHYIEELTDLATVCIMNIRHLGYDFETEFEKVVMKNEKRAKK